jgi:hypothetical protein
MAFAGGFMFGFNLTTNVPMSLVGAVVWGYAIFFWKEDE